MFSKMLIFTFCVIGLFAVLFAAIPIAFFIADTTYSSTIGATQEIVDRFDLANVTMYGNAGSDNASYTYSSLTDAPSAPQWEAGLPTDQYLEVWWNKYSWFTHQLEFRHVTKVWYGWSLTDRCDFWYENKTKVPYQRLSATIVQSNYNHDENASIFYAECSHVTSSAFFVYNQTKYSSISDSWNSGEIGYILSYEVDWNATSISALTVLGQLLTFQTPNLGIPGDVGTIFNAVIALPFLVMVIIMVIILVQSVIPFIKGLVSG